ncbi:MAG: HAD-IA family hydrolase [Cyanobacteria bacterium RI_101]|nr:HAD-IA family hydrolase [Cyanobacteria bacterium RI_101]
MPTLHCGSLVFPDCQAVIFDKDGTLENSWDYLVRLTEARLDALERRSPGVSQRLAPALGYRDGELDPAGLMAVGSRRDCQIASAVVLAQAGWGWFECLSFAQASFEEADRQVSAVSSLFPGVRDCLERLRQGGFKLGILSAARTAVVEKFVETHQLAPYFQVLMGSDLTYAKPDPALYRQVCDLLGVKPERTLMIGDAQGDIAMARQCGAPALALCWPELPPRTLTGMTGVIASLEPLG